MHRILAQYDRRIVNVNVNIILAGVLALIPTTFTVWVVRHYLGVTSNELITGITFVADAISDVLVYYLLHYLANHMPRPRAAASQNSIHAHTPFFKDATLVQFERMCISPLLYIIALGTQYSLMEWWEVGATLATVIGFVLGIGVSRIIHTWWMIRTERIAATKLTQTPKPDSTDVQ
jgi:hypothetical protein